MRPRRTPIRSVLVLLALSWSPESSPGATTVGRLADQRTASADASIQFLVNVMDRFHDRVPIYDDVSSGGNHFVALGALPDEFAAVSINGSWASNPHSGATSMRCVFSDTPGDNYGGFYFLNGVLPDGETAPQLNFGTVPDAGFDLTGASVLSFWARGEVGGEKFEVFVAGVGRDASSGVPTEPYPDSSPRHPPLGTTVTLSATWQRYEIDVSALDLSYVLGGFGWAANDVHNPGGAVFYLDDIEYRLNATAKAARLDQPRFLTSYVTHDLQPDPFDGNPDDDIDLVLRNMAFSYDNALAILAFLSDGSPDSLRRAKLIGDAFVYASGHDRSYIDGRIRSGYAAGDISLPPGWTPNNLIGTVPVPGFYYEPTQQFFEVEQQHLDVGNNAWTMISLLALHRVTGEASYFNSALQIGEFVRGYKNMVGTFQGFLGGTENPEGETPTEVPWASAEHNLDVYAAFSVMFDLTANAQWQTDAQHARTFVEAIWDAGLGCYRAGTLDKDTLNTMPEQLPLDVQAWSILALEDGLVLQPELLACVETHHRAVDAGFSGFDFNNDNDGVWFEGTAQMATAYLLAGQSALAAALRAELRTAQTTPPFGDSMGIVAASRDGLTTGFGFKYFRRLHIAVAAWNVFAQRGFNPYYQTPFGIFLDGFESGDTSAWSATVP